jgi:aspartyl protease family protein
MQLRYIFALFVGAVLAGWMMPGGLSFKSPADTPPAQVQTIPAETRELAKEEQQEREGIALRRQPDGHFYANAAVNASNDEGAVRFLVDTGASGIALTGADADALGLSWDESELQIVGRGVSGDVLGKPVILKSVQVGDITAYDVQAAIIPEGLDVSLLGQSFLSKVGSVNIQGNEMTFE